MVLVYTKQDTWIDSEIVFILIFSNIIIMIERYKATILRWNFSFCKKCCIWATFGAPRIMFTRPPIHSPTHTPLLPRQTVSFVGPTQGHTIRVCGQSLVLFFVADCPLAVGLIVRYRDLKVRKLLN